MLLLAHFILCQLASSPECSPNKQPARRKRKENDQKGEKKKNKCKYIKWISSIADDIHNQEKVKGTNNKKEKDPNNSTAPICTQRPHLSLSHTRVCLFLQAHWIHNDEIYDDPKPTECGRHFPKKKKKIIKKVVLFWGLTLFPKCLKMENSIDINESLRNIGPMMIYNHRRHYK